MPVGRHATSICTLKSNSTSSEMRTPMEQSYDSNGQCAPSGKSCVDTLGRGYVDHSLIMMHDNTTLNALSALPAHPSSQRV